MAGLEDNVKRSVIAGYGAVSALMLATGATYVLTSTSLAGPALDLKDHVLSGAVKLGGVTGCVLFGGLVLAEASAFVGEMAQLTAQGVAMACEEDITTTPARRFGRIVGITTAGAGLLADVATGAYILAKTSPILQASADNGLLNRALADTTSATAKLLLVGGVAVVASVGVGFAAPFARLAAEASARGAEAIWDGLRSLHRHDTPLSIITGKPA